ncbi:hypothetical protein ACRRTK_023441 [Alexandromys fortis]
MINNQAHVLSDAKVPRVHEQAIDQLRASSHCGASCRAEQQKHDWKKVKTSAFSKAAEHRVYHALALDSGLCIVNGGFGSRKVKKSSRTLDDIVKVIKTMVLPDPSDLESILKDPPQTECFHRWAVRQIESPNAITRCKRSVKENPGPNSDAEDLSGNPWL